MEKSKRTYSFYGNSELDDLLREFQQKNNIESKSKAIKLLLDTGLRNWSSPAEAVNYDKMIDDVDESLKKKHYEIITGLKK